MTDATIDHVHLVFKTHLDLGFTALAREVLQRYLTDFLPGAIHLARRLREADTPMRFRWTTGSWLIDTFLEQSVSSARREMETAIEAGDIAWHALPFTTHTELMDADLFRFSLSISQRLDQRFGRQTIAGKMTDVPGHTRGMVPLLAEVGVEFLHIGVNEASPLPDVPPLFRWLDSASGQQITVLYHAAYGLETAVPELGTALVIASTGDNIGPQNEASVQKTYQQLQTRFPKARIIASTLDAFALELRAIQDQLPVVTSEIGDAWIHGVGTDPTKVRRFRALSRLRLHWLQNGQMQWSDPVHQAFSKKLLCVPEHTWGYDVKTHLTTKEAYTPRLMAEAKQLPKFQEIEKSWDEQRHYLDDAVAVLSDTAMHADALAILQTDPAPRIEPGQLITDNEYRFETPTFEIGFDAQTGAIYHLRNRKDGHLWASPDNPLGLFRYETFSQADYDTFWEQFIRNKDSEEVRGWAIHDYTKPGIAAWAEKNRLIPAQFISLYQTQEPQSTHFTINLKSRPDLTAKYGAPEQVDLLVTVDHVRPRLSMQLKWSSKPPTVLPEAAWLSFIPLQNERATWKFEKLGSWIDPLDVVKSGNRHLHAINERIRYQETQAAFLLTTYDAPLVAPGEPSLLRFMPELPDMEGGLHVNLFNNLWGTNFPLWIEGAASFRFDLDFS